MQALTTLLWAFGLIVVPLTAVVCACTQAAAAWERREDLGRHLLVHKTNQNPQPLHKQCDAAPFGSESAQGTEGARAI